jgi:hypothetical protein
MKRYQLTLFVGEPNEQVVYADLTEKDVEMINMDMQGELNCQYYITLDNYDIIDVGIIDYIEEV